MIGQFHVRTDEWTQLLNKRFTHQIANMYLNYSEIKKGKISTTQTKFGKMHAKFTKKRTHFALVECKILFFRKFVWVLSLDQLGKRPTRFWHKK